MTIDDAFNIILTRFHKGALIIIAIRKSGMT